MLAEQKRLDDAHARVANWQRWGPYLSERQWGTVREDYSADGSCWDYFPHDHARSRAYRWGEDGLLGFTDRECRLCFALALWNGQDPILKERLFGLTCPEGNHGEDVKEAYFYLDATPTYSYAKGLYKYPQAAFPYARLVDENRRRTRHQPEFELKDTGVFDQSRYFDVVAEYAKAAPDDIVIRLTITNRGPAAARLVVLPTIWFRNTWSWGCAHEGCWVKPQMQRDGDAIVTRHATLPKMRMTFGLDPSGAPPALLFTDNETNNLRLFGSPNAGRYVKDAFHTRVIGGDASAVNPEMFGTKSAGLYRLSVPAGRSVTLRMRLTAADAPPPRDPLGADFDRVFALRIREADDFYAAKIPGYVSKAERGVARQAYAGLLWTKQFYHYIVRDWRAGDPAQPAPPAKRLEGRNAEWPNLYNRDVISMPDKWEYPWYAAWDLAFHMVPFAHIDPQFAKDQLVLMMREWYMHPNGQLPAYEFALGDVNPPVHAWACWRVYKMTGPRGARDREFLVRVFHKLLINFTWWVNRKDPEGKNLFSGGFLGLDNIGVFDRNKPLPTGGHLEQADATAWMAFYCVTMLSMAIELAAKDSAYEDVASKFFEHFVAIADAMNTLGGTGLWDERDGFYYDQIQLGGGAIPLRVRSMVGLVPLFAAEVIEGETLQRIPGFRKRAKWFLENRKDLAKYITYMVSDSADAAHAHFLLAIPSQERLTRVLRYVLDENELLSPYGIRSVSRFHKDHPYTIHVNGDAYSVEYVPGDSNTSLFGGNSNWRGPVWFPVNYLLIETLERYHYFYGDSLRIEFPTGSGRLMTLADVAHELYQRLTRLFLPDERGRRPCHGDDPRYANDPHWRDLVLFHEYFNGDNGAGVGASHQTGWTALVTRCLERTAARREAEATAQASLAAARRSGQEQVGAGS